MGLAYSVVDECAHDGQRDEQMDPRDGDLSPISAFEAELEIRSRDDEIGHLRRQLGEAHDLLGRLRHVVEQVRLNGDAEARRLAGGSEWPGLRAKVRHFERTTRASIEATLGVHTPPNIQSALDLREWISPGMESHGEIQPRDLPTEVSR